MVHRILIPLDGSDFAEQAIPFALMVPSRSVLLLLVEPEQERAVNNPLQGAGGARPREAVAQSYLDAMGESFRRDGREVEAAIQYGDPAERIVETSVEVDLIVMTTHARGAGGRLIYGSFADRVARHASVPTLLVRGGLAAEAPAAFRRIVVPLDGSEMAEQVLPHALRLAGEMRLPLHLLRVADPSVLYGTAAAVALTTENYEAIMSRLDDEAAFYLKDLVHRADTGLHVTTEVRRGSPAGEVIDATGPGDLLVMTTHGHGGIRRWFIGSVAEKLVRQAAVPVLLVHVHGIQHPAPTPAVETAPDVIADAGDAGA